MRYEDPDTLTSMDSRASLFIKERLKNAEGIKWQYWRGVLTCYARSIHLLLTVYGFDLSV
jgi:hypothetical protein